jgi:hypothetical protein
MIVAAHQPNFMPWLGYFDKMRRADVFVSVDHVQLERQGFQSRTRIKTGDGSRWISVPVVHASRDERIVDARIDNSRDGRFRWGRKMALTLRYAYESAPHYRAYGPALAEVLEQRWERVVDLNMKLIELMREALMLRTPIVRSSELRVSGAKSEMVLNMCREVGASAYLTGAGASRGYLDVAAFERAGIEVLWQDFSHPRYEQRPSPASFIERLSAVDLLFNCGAASAAALRAGSTQAPALADAPASILAPSGGIPA